MLNWDMSLLLWMIQECVSRMEVLLRPESISVLTSSAAGTVPCVPAHPLVVPGACGPRMAVPKVSISGQLGFTACFCHTCFSATILFYFATVSLQSARKLSRLCKTFSTKIHKRCQRDGPGAVTAHGPLFQSQHAHDSSPQSQGAGPRVPNALFWPLWVVHLLGAQIHTYRQYTHAHTFKRREKPN